jgi:tetratricopeptide (TPR) repeat protein
MRKSVLFRWTAMKNMNLLVQLMIPVSLFAGLSFPNCCYGQGLQGDGMQDSYTGEPTTSEYGFNYKPESNMDVMGGVRAQGDALLFQVEYAMKTGNYKEALPIIKRALEQNDDDMDLHVIYAKALEQEFKAQDKRDPKLFNKLVKEWLIVMREERGPEKGLYFHGFATPYGMSFGDEDHALLAAAHLKKLTGTVPRNGQSDKNYLKHVLKPVDTEVTGKLIKKSIKEQEP